MMMLKGLAVKIPLAITSIILPLAVLHTRRRIKGEIVQSNLPVLRQGNSINALAI